MRPPYVQQSAKVPRLLFNLLWKLKLSFERRAIENLKDIYGIPDSVEIFYPIVYSGNITIGAHTYFMKYCELVTGPSSKISIGSNCAFAKNVTVRALTHDYDKPLARLTNLKEADVRIGDNCWIGANVFIREGVELGNNCVVGANSVVTKSFPDNSIVGGVPARLIKAKNAGGTY